MMLSSLSSTSMDVTSMDAVLRRGETELNDYMRVQQVSDATDPSR
jgi:hypothetical protein